MQGIQLSASMDAGTSNRAKVYQEWRKEIASLKSVIGPTFEDNPRIKNQLIASTEALQTALNPEQSTGNRASALLTSLKAWQGLSQDIAQEDPQFVKELPPTALLKATSATGQSMTAQLSTLQKRAGLTTGLAAQVKNVHFTGSATMTDGLKKELESLIKGFLENGIENLTELRNILMLVGALGFSISPGILQDIKISLKEFIDGEAGSKHSMEDFMSLLNLIKSMSSSELGAPLVDENDMESRHFQNQLQITPAPSTKKDEEVDKDGRKTITSISHEQPSDKKSKPVAAQVTTVTTASSKSDKKSDELTATTGINATDASKKASKSGFSQDSGSDQERDRQRLISEIKREAEALLETQIDTIAGKLFDEITKFLRGQLDHQADRIIDLTPIAEAEDDDEGIVI